MKLMILGATGGTGLQVVRKAIERGHSVTAFVRSPDRLKPFCDSITVRLIFYTMIWEAIHYQHVAALKIV